MIKLLRQAQELAESEATFRQTCGEWTELLRGKVGKASPSRSFPGSRSWFRSRRLFRPEYPETEQFHNFVSRPFDITM